MRAASQIFGSTSSSDFDLSPRGVQVSRRLGNLGDEAHLYVGRCYVDDVERLSPPVAVIQVNKDNASVTVCCIERTPTLGRFVWKGAMTAATTITEYVGAAAVIVAATARALLGWLCSELGDGKCTPDGYCSEITAWPWPNCPHPLPGLCRPRQLPPSGTADSRPR